MPFARSDNEHLHLNDHRREARLFFLRVATSLILVVILFVILIARFYNLQVSNHQDYVTRSDSNRIKVQPIAPTRGLIYDRNGILLADNKPSYTLSIVKERVKDLEATINNIAELIPVEMSDRDHFKRSLKQRRRPYEAVPLRYRLTENEMAIIAVNEYRLSGVEVEAQLVRYYPFGELFAHTVGYVGRINERELKGFSEDVYKLYSGTHSIGKTGIEKYYESTLLGTVGSQHIEVNVHGRVLRVLERIDPEPGKDLYLTLDVELQNTAAFAMEGKRGAVVVMDVKNGEILSLVSSPSYDANLFVTGISYDQYKQLQQSDDLPLFNRTTQGQYPPASTLKPMLGLEGLNSGVITPQWEIFDPGYYQLKKDGRFYRDWKKWGHGKHVDLRQAITESCDTFFYDLSIKLGIDRMHPAGVAFGLGSKTGIDIPSEKPGLWPSRPWKEGARELPWFPGDSLNVSIGQGDVLATPLQLGVMVGVLASRGRVYRPRIVKRIDDVLTELEFTQNSSIKEEHWDYVASAMENVMHGRRGTARAIAKGAEYRIAGKTGTAQVVAIAQDESYDRDKVKARNRDHALFIAYAPADKPEIAIAVIIENGEHGSSAAAPVARQLFDRWFEIQKNRKPVDKLQVPVDPQLPSSEVNQQITSDSRGYSQ